MELNIEQCGFCGRYFKGLDYISLMNFHERYAHLADVKLGYCPEAETEDPNYHESQKVTRDMAIDSGDLSLEGELI